MHVHMNWVIMKQVYKYVMCILGSLWLHSLYNKHFFKNLHLQAFYGSQI